MKCDKCPIPKQYEYGENVEICSLFGWDNDDEHFKMYADGSDARSVELCLRKTERSLLLT